MVSEYARLPTAGLDVLINCVGDRFWDLGVGVIWATIVHPLTVEKETS